VKFLLKKWKKRVQKVQNTLLFLLSKSLIWGGWEGFLCSEIEMQLWTKSSATPPPTPPVGQGAKKTGKNSEIS
jgi:hypothetical protein